MQLTDAAALAAEIEADERFRVIAIGKFELVDHLVTAQPHAYPWAVSAVAVHDTTYRNVLRTRGDWVEWRDLAPVPAPPEPPRARKPKREPVATEPPAELPEQPLLF